MMSAALLANEPVTTGPLYSHEIIRSVPGGRVDLNFLFVTVTNGHAPSLSNMKPDRTLIDRAVIPNLVPPLAGTAVRNLLFSSLRLRLAPLMQLPENCAISPITIFRMNTSEKCACNYV